MESTGRPDAEYISIALVRSMCNYNSIFYLVFALLYIFNCKKARCSK